MGKQPTDSDRVEALIHASVHGDESACAKWGCTDRTLRNWRRDARDPESKLSGVFRLYSAALRPEAGAEARAESFPSFVEGQVRRLCAVIERKAEEINAANPQSIEAVSGLVGKLLEHMTSLAYIAGLFSVPDDEVPDGPRAVQ